VHVVFHPRSQASLNLEGPDFLRSSLPVLVMISSMSVPIRIHFHVRRANSGRITLFKGGGGAPLSPPRSWGPPSPSGMKFCHKILETRSYHTVKNQKSLSHLGSDWYRVVRHQDKKTELP